VSTGIYALSKRILQCVDFKSKDRLDMPELILQAVQQGHPVLCYTAESVYWRDIGRFDHYEAAAKDFEKAPQRFLGAPNGHGTCG
jgi:NDP-sugar pyrophosphorylase family protein